MSVVILKTTWLMNQVIAELHRAKGDIYHTQFIKCISFDVLFGHGCGNHA